MVEAVDFGGLCLLSRSFLDLVLLASVCDKIIGILSVHLKSEVPIYFCHCVLNELIDSFGVEAVPFILSTGLASVEVLNESSCQVCSNAALHWLRSSWVLFDVVILGMTNH